jgi:predicted amino acid dehydrogenase
MVVSRKKIAYGEKQIMAPIVRNPDSVRAHFPGISVWRWARRNLAKLSEPKYSEIREKIGQLGQADVTRIIASRQGMLRIRSLDLSMVSETDMRACVEPRTIFSGNVLDLDNLQRIKRGPIQVLGNILGGWLRLKFPNFKQKKYDFAFMVHPRTYADVLRGVPFLKYLPESWTRALVKRLPPFKLSDMTGLTDISGKPITGALMCIGWDREMFEKDVRGREEKIADLVKLARNMGIKYVGFAALLPWASRYGQCLEGTVSRAEIEKIFEKEKVSWDQLAELFADPKEHNPVPKPWDQIEQKIKALNASGAAKEQLASIFKWAYRVGDELRGMTITTGHPFTVAIINSFVKKIVELHPKKDPLVAIIGAAGSTGSCCAVKLAKEGVNNFLLVDRVKSTGVTSLADLKSEIVAESSKAKVATSTDLGDIIKADIVIVVSSAAGTIVKSEYLKPGAIIVDDSQPRNVDPQVAKDRPDIRIVTVLAPIDGLIPNFYFDRHTPFTGACFTCAGDVSLRMRTHTPIGATGPAKMEAVEIIERMAEQTKAAIGFDPLRPVFYTYDRGNVSYDEITRIASLT